ncbi:hypothetical protein BJ742DRAFT_115414 [Cladochytrium replicatum]|nr:hypothetical protein BJ742DRAFT_115414 [Cladochytrium replicatum]
MDATELFNQHAVAIDELRISATGAFRNLVLSDTDSKLIVRYHDLEDVAEILVDDALLLRFLKKHKFSVPQASIHLVNHITWRLQNDISTSVLHLPTLINSKPRVAEYLRRGLFRFIGVDGESRPLARLDLKGLGKDDPEDLRVFLIFALECVRRSICSANLDCVRSHIKQQLKDTVEKLKVEKQRERSISASRNVNRRRKGRSRMGSSSADGGGRPSQNDSSAEHDGDGDDEGDDVIARGSSPEDVQSLKSLTASLNATKHGSLKAQLVFQLSVLIDLDGVAIASLNAELIPLLYELFSKQFPQAIGIVYVLNYGWIHAGVWSLIRAALPSSATQKVKFLTADAIQKACTIYSNDNPAPYSAKFGTAINEFDSPNFQFYTRWGRQDFDISIATEPDGWDTTEDESGDEEDLGEDPETGALVIGGGAIGSLKKALKETSHTSRFGAMLQELDAGDNLGYVTAIEDDGATITDGPADEWYDAPEPDEDYPSSARRSRSKARVKSAADLQRMLRSPSVLRTPSIDRMQHFQRVGSYFGSGGSPMGGGMRMTPLTPMGHTSKEKGDETPLRASRTSRARSWSGISQIKPLVLSARGTESRSSDNQLSVRGRSKRNSGTGPAVSGFVVALVLILMRSRWVFTSKAFSTKSVGVAAGTIGLITFSTLALRRLRRSKRRRPTIRAELASTRTSVAEKPRKGNDQFSDTEDDESGELWLKVDTPVGSERATASGVHRRQDGVHRDPRHADPRKDGNGSNHRRDTDPRIAFIAATAAAVVVFTTVFALSSGMAEEEGTGESLTSQAESDLDLPIAETSDDLWVSKLYDKASKAFNSVWRRVARMVKGEEDAEVDDTIAMGD